MKSTTSFQELAQLQKEQLSKQPPVTLEEMKAQVLRVKHRSKSNNKNKLNNERT